MPIKTRIDMLATGIKTPVGIKVSRVRNLQPPSKAIGQQLETILAEDLPGYRLGVFGAGCRWSLYQRWTSSEKRQRAMGSILPMYSRSVATAIGGMNVSQTVEGLERYPINLRYPQDYRELTRAVGATADCDANRASELHSADVAHMSLSKMARQASKAKTLASMVGYPRRHRQRWMSAAMLSHARQRVVERELQMLPPGYAISWSGQYEYMQRAKEKLTFVIPLTLGNHCGTFI